MQQQMVQAHLAQQGGSLLAALNVNAINNGVQNGHGGVNVETNHGMPDMAALRQAYLAHLVNQTRTHPAEIFQHQCRHCALGFGNPTIYQVSESLNRQ